MSTLLQVHTKEAKEQGQQMADEVCKTGDLRKPCNNCVQVNRQAQSPTIVTEVIEAIPSLKQRDRTFLLQGIGSLRCLAQATEEQLLNQTPIAADKVPIVVNYFQHDTVKDE